MTVNAEQAWQLAENRCFEFLAELLDGEEGTDCFIGDLPMLSEIWCFAINGGGAPEQAWGVSTPPCPSWRMNAIFEARYSERTTAQDVAGKIRNSLPKKTGLTGIEVFRQTAEPSLAAEYVQLPNSTNVNRFWRLTQPLEVVFKNVTT